MKYWPIKETLLFCSEDVLPFFERKYGITRSAVVDDLLEDSCYSEEGTLESFIGGRGTIEDRLIALRNVINASGNGVGEYFIFLQDFHVKCLDYKVLVDVFIDNVNVETFTYEKISDANAWELILDFLKKHNELDMGFQNLMYDPKDPYQTPYQTAFVNNIKSIINGELPQEIFDFLRKNNNNYNDLSLLISYPSRRV